MKLRKVAEAVAEGLAQKKSANKDKAQATLEETARCAFSDIRQIFDSSGRLIPPHLLPDDVAAAVSSIELEERFDRGEDVPHVVKKIRLWNKTESLRLLADLLGMVKTRTEHSGAVGTYQIIDPYAQPPPGPSRPEGEEE